MPSSRTSFVWWSRLRSLFTSFDCLGSGYDRTDSALCVRVADTPVRNGPAYQYRRNRSGRQRMVEIENRVVQRQRGELGSTPAYRHPWHRSPWDYHHSDRVYQYHSSSPHHTATENR